MDNQASAQPNLAEVLRILQAIEGRISRIEQERSDRGPRGGNGGLGGGNETGSRTATGRTYAEATRRPPPRTHTPAARVDHGTTQGPRGGQESRRQPDHSDHGNRDFNQLAFALYRICQLKHHGKIWNQLPAKLRAYLHEFFLLIRPPMPDQELSSDLQKLFDETASKVQQVVTRHIARKLEDTKRVVTRCNPHAKEEAAAKARELLHTRLGQKIRQGNVDAWLDEALRSTGSGGEWRGGADPSPNVPVPDVATDLITFAAVEVPTGACILPEEDAMEVVSRKRKAREDASPLTQAVPTRNRFAALDDETTPEEEHTPAAHTPVQNILKRKNESSTPPTRTGSTPTTDDETATSGWAIEELPIVMQSQPTRSSRDAPASPIASPPRAATQSGGNPTCMPRTPTIHPQSPKTEWSVRVRPGTTTLVLADSNFKAVTNIPDGWDVHVYPGASWAHAYQMLTKHKATVRPENIVLAFGVNNRDQQYSTWYHDMSRCYSAAKRLAEDTYILGVSATGRKPSQLNLVQLRNLDEMNTAARKLAKTRFIPPLFDEEVNIAATDLLFGIHHTPATVETVKMSIQKFLN